jgi:hypothetical protein
VNRAYHQGTAFTAGASQDVWSVAVIALELRSVTPIKHQTGAIPGYAHEALAKHFEVLTSWYQNLWEVGLGRIGVSAEDAPFDALLIMRSGKKSVSVWPHFRQASRKLASDEGRKDGVLGCE